MAETQKAALFYGANDIRVEEIPLVYPGKGEVMIKIGWCGICGTDLHEFQDGPHLTPSKQEAHVSTGSRLPVVLGHEFAGTITHLGSELQGVWKVGDRVAVDPLLVCHQCFSCKHDNHNSCTKIGFSGLAGYGGGLAEYSLVKEESLYKLPDNIDMRTGAMIEPLAVAVHAIRRSGFKKGDTALVLGGGPIGLFIAATLVAMDAGKVILSEPSAQRRKMAKVAGAHHIFSPMDVDVVEECKKLTGGADCGVDVAFECAGIPATSEAGLAALHANGTMVQVALTSKNPVVNVNKLVMGEKTLKGAMSFCHDHPVAIELLTSGKLNLNAFITATIKIDDIVEGGFKQLLHNNENHVKILANLSGTDPE